MAIELMTSEIFVMQEKWDAMQNRTIDLIFYDELKVFQCDKLVTSFR